MEWGLIASSAITAGVVSAAVNAMFGWFRFRAESRDRRNETRREQLRSAVVDFLAAEADAYERAGRYIAIGQLLRAIREEQEAGEKPSAGPREKYLADYMTAMQADAAAANVARQAIARLRLYSAHLHLDATTLLDLRRNEAVHDDLANDEPPAAHRDRALALFVAEARAELGIDRL